MNKQQELFEKELTELSDFNYLARKTLVRFEDAIDSLNNILATVSRMETKLDIIQQQTIKEEMIENES